jgi:hypothetical protein
LSIAISIFITVVNILLAGILFYDLAIIRALTIFEKDYRWTYMQISLTVKIIIAQLLNSIALTLLANYYIKKNLYKSGGLA